MKTFKKVLCILLSSIFLLFAGGCQVYKDNKSNEFISFKITTDKTACSDEDEWVNIEYEITVKKDFWIYCSYTQPVEKFIYPIAVNDKYDESYYRDQFNSRTGIDTEHCLKNTHLESGVSEAIMSLHCKKGKRYGTELSVRRSYNNVRIDKVEKGNYRIYLVVYCFYPENPFDEKGERIESVKGINYLIPTDIVLNMQ